MRLMKFTDNSARKALAIVSFVLLGFATEAAAKAAASVASVSGSVDVFRGAAERGAPLMAGEELFAGDAVRTKTGSRAEIRFASGSVIKIGERSKVAIDKASNDGKRRRCVLTLSRGKIKAYAGSSSEAAKKAGTAGAADIEIHTNTSVITASDAVFFAFYMNSLTGVYSEAGSVKTYHKLFPGTVIDVKSGLHTMITNDKPAGVAVPYMPGDYHRLEGDIGEPFSAARP